MIPTPVPLSLRRHANFESVYLNIPISFPVGYRIVSSWSRHAKFVTNSPPSFRTSIYCNRREIGRLRPLRTLRLILFNRKVRKGRKEKTSVFYPLPVYHLCLACKTPQMMTHITVITLNAHCVFLAHHMSVRRQNFRKGLTFVRVKNAVFQVLHLAVQPSEGSSITMAEHPVHSSPRATINRFNDPMFSFFYR